jgi:hypothetical protein
VVANSAQSPALVIPGTRYRRGAIAPVTGTEGFFGSFARRESGSWEGARANS